MHGAHAIELVLRALESFLRDPRLRPVCAGVCVEQQCLRAAGPGLPKDAPQPRASNRMWAQPVVQLGGGVYKHTNVPSRIQQQACYR